MIEKTVAFLKISVDDQNSPAAEGLIRASLGKAGLKFRSVDVTLAEQELVDIYSNLSGTPALDAYLSATITQLAHRQLCAFLISGESAIERVYRLKGMETDPMKCAYSSWRYRLAMVIVSRRVRLLKPGGEFVGTFIENFVHAPSPDEVARNLKVLEKYFG